jgi:hypothetical protein
VAVNGTDSDNPGDTIRAIANPTPATAISARPSGEVKSA